MPAAILSADETAQAIQQALAPVATAIAAQKAEYDALKADHEALKAWVAAHLKAPG